MGRELTFYPETERNRDLLYSEYTSRDRSVHVLIQDNGVERYRFLLDVYRDVVAHYLSYDPIEAPVAFLQRVATQLEAHAESSKFSVDDFQTAGIYVLLRATDAYYLLMSRDDHVYLHAPETFMPLRAGDGVETVRSPEREAQEELFPQRVTDSMTLLRIDAYRLEGADLVVGCGDEDKGAVVEALDDPMGIAAHAGIEADAGLVARKAVSSRFITRKIVAVGLDPAGMAPAGEVEDPSKANAGKGRLKGLAVVTGVAAIAIAASLLTRSVIMPALENRQAAGSKSPDVSALPEDALPIADAIEAAAESPTADVEEAPPPAPPAFEDNWVIEFSSPVTSSPAIHEAAVVFGCRDSSLYSIDRASGEVQWRYRAADGVGASPALLGQVVIGADYKGNVFGLNAATGEPVWTWRLPGKVVSSPCVAGNRVLVGCYDGKVYCLDGRTGDVLWEKAAGGRVRANTVTDGVRFFVPSYNGKVYALSCETGRELWSYTAGGNLTGGAAVSDGRVFVGAPDGRLHAINTDTGKSEWVVKAGGPLKSSVTVADGRVFAGSNDRHVYCFEAATGGSIWSFKTGGIVLSAPTLRAGVLFAGSYDGILYCLDAATGQLLDRADTAGEIYSTPVVRDGKVYLGNNKGRFLSVAYQP